QEERTKETTRPRQRNSQRELDLAQQGFKRFDPPGQKQVRTYWVPTYYSPLRYEVERPTRGKLPVDKKFRYQHRIPNPNCERCGCWEEHTKQVSKGDKSGVDPCGCSDSDCLEDNCTETHPFPVILDIKKKETAKERTEQPEETGIETPTREEQELASDESGESDKVVVVVVVVSFIVSILY